MAKDKHVESQSDVTKRINRTEAYAEEVRMMFAEAVNDILALHKSVPHLDEGVMYSFDDSTKKIQQEAEETLRRLHSVTTLAIEAGIALEWDRANKECDELVRSCFGKDVAKSKKFAAWMQRNDEARRAFIARTDKNGMNLSKRIWRDVQQLKEEMEVAMTVAIGEGKSAASMSRKVRKYLDDPDLMFRRFRYKIGEDENGNPTYGRKWKKRVIDPVTGKKTWIDYDRDSYKTGQGVYKSAAKNAMRVTRTETNMAYRRADHERWQQMDFVLGIKIELSNQHPVTDICDFVQGDYPKDFVFDGWHPQCFCYATPILISEDEMAKVSEAFARGETYIPKGKPVTDTPKGFKKWVKDHKEQIQTAKNPPYWVRNNKDVVNGIWGKNASEDVTVAKMIKLGRAETKRAVTELSNLPKEERLSLTIEQKEQVPQIEKLLNVKHGKPMTLLEADMGKTNPFGYSDNCQASVVTMFARMLGYDVNAGRYSSDINSSTFIVGENIAKAFLHSDGSPVKEVKPWNYTKISKSKFISEINKRTKSVGVYEFGLNKKSSGHAVLAVRTQNRNLYIAEATSLKEDFHSLDYLYEEWESIEVLRIDDKILNLKYLKGLINP